MTTFQIMSNAAQEEPAPVEKVITIRILESINEKVEDASKVTGLKKADVLRLAIERGVDVLLKQLTQTEEGASK